MNFQSVYFDNGATSFPKPPEVAEAIHTYVTQVGGNVGRGCYGSAFDAGEVVYETREMLAKFFDFPGTPEHVIFTKNITESLNVVIKGLLHPGDHVIVSSLEHNAVMRPLMSLADKQVTFSRIPCDEYGSLRLDELHKHVQANTKAVIMTHASNVSGTVLELQEVGVFCQQYGLDFIIDTAQTAGSIPVSFQELNATILCFTGHKGLLGPQGVGGFLIKQDAAKRLVPLVQGGTGSLSEQEVHPLYMPDKFEAGTLNIPGIYGLWAGIKYFERIGLASVTQCEIEIVQRFLEKVAEIPTLKVIGTLNGEKKVPLVSLVCETVDHGELTHMLYRDFGIMTRSGLHCAPNAHKAFGTFPDGTVRFSFSHYNTKAEIDYAVDVLHKIIK